MAIFERPSLILSQTTTLSLSGNTAILFGIIAIKTVVRQALMYSADTCGGSTREEVGCGGNEDVKMDEWSHQGGQN